MRKIQTLIYLLEAVCVSLKHLEDYLEDEPLKRETNSIRQAYEQRKQALQLMLTNKK